MDIKNEMTVKGKISTVIGADGRSAYELAVLKGFDGTLDEWLNSLKGDKGDTPIKGVDYYTPTEKNSIVAEIESEVTGDIDTALDKIIAIQDSLIRNSVSFRIDGPALQGWRTFVVAPGTTWGEWATTPEGSELIYDDDGELRGALGDENLFNMDYELQTLSTVILPEDYVLHNV
jgi:hypothetical protein